MAKKLCIFIHGVGNQSNNHEGWAHKLTDAVSKIKYDSYECLWSDISQTEQDVSFSRRFTKPAWWKVRELITYYFRKFIFDFAVDATAYNNYQEKLVNQLKDCCQNHSIMYDEIILVGYSLGGWIAYDFLHKHHKEYPKVQGLITVGSSIPLNRLDRFTGFPLFPWVNIWTTHDVLSMPFKMPNITDVQYGGSIPLISDTIASHIEYTTSSRFAKFFAYTVKKMDDIIPDMISKRKKMERRAK